MFKRILVCPGQGKFDVESLAFLANKAKEQPVESLLKRADDAVPELQLSRFILSPSDHSKEVQYTRVQQPLLILKSYLNNELLKCKGVDLSKEADYMVGHSLGEISGLVLQGVLGFEEGLRAGYERGRLMEEVLPPGEYGMRALMFQPQNFEVIVKLLQELEINIANYNTYSQVVVSGECQELDSKLQKLQETLIKYKVWKTRVRVVDLGLHIPFHHPLLEPIVPELSKILVGSGKLQVPFVANYDGTIVHDTAEQIQKTLKVTSKPVYFTKCLEHFKWKDDVAYEFINYGSATQGLVKRFNSDLIKLRRSNHQARLKNITVEELLY